MDNMEKIAREFSREITEWLGVETIREVIALNESYKGTKYEGCCATGNYCDSNMAMAYAFKQVMGRNLQYSYDEETGEETPELQALHEADCELWNSAWDMAKNNNFYLN